MAAACGADERLEEVAAGGAPRATKAASEPENPAGLRAAYITAAQASAPETYRIERGALGLWAANPAQALVTEFNAAGVWITPGPGPSEGAWSWSLAASRWGCAGELDPVPMVDPEANENRATYEHQAEGLRAGLIEWYLNGPLGLEQGFTLPSAPACRGRGGREVVIELAMGGDLAAAVVDGGQAVELRDGSGAVALTYTDLFVTDAAAKVLPARLEVSGDRLIIRVDDAGAVYPLTVDPLVGVQQQKLLASDVAAGDLFGNAVAVSGDTAVIGGHLNGDAGVQSGSAYVFTRSGATWTQQQKLLPADGAAGDFFGYAVAVSGDTAVLGARGDDDLGSSSGSAYVFTRSGVTWSQQQKLLSGDGLASDQFGFAVAIAGDTVVVGAIGDDDVGSNAGSAFVFTRAGVTWSQQAKLLAADGAASDSLGIAVAVVNDTAVIGSYLDDDLGADSGSAYVFTRAGVTWTQQAKLLASDGLPGDNFGRSVAVVGDTVLVGAYNDDDNGLSSGSAFVFTRAGVTWSQQAKLLASDGVASDNFGFSVALSGDTAVVGARYDDDNGTDSGSAYAFTRVGAVWIQQSKLLASDGSTSDNLGTSVALAVDTAVMGAPTDNHNGTAGVDSGSAYVFVLKKALGDPCGAALECASGSCVDGYCCNTTCGGGASNDCQACNVAGQLGTCSLLSPGPACRPAADLCDAPETCDGLGPNCPADIYLLPGTSCRGAVNACDAAESCTGGIACPPDIFQMNGTPCNDGDVCTQSDTCQAGACSSGSPVVCPMPDQCHNAGTCNPGSGMCSNPIKTNGSVCNDGDACTQSDTCQAGACSGNNPVVCPMPDQCHNAGTCNSGTGLCSNPIKTNGSVCNDGDACTQSDTCQTGACSGGNPVVCPMPDQCHELGVCDPLLGSCSNPEKAPGTPCADGLCDADGVCVPSDSDGDGILDAEDNCPFFFNMDQVDTDHDGAGDGCDTDDDGDDIDDASDNCPLVANEVDTDTDGDGDGDACDTDDDGDTLLDADDNCPLFQNQGQADTNGDGVGDDCDCSDPANTACDDGNACTQTDICLGDMGDVCTGTDLYQCVQPPDPCLIALCQPATGGCLTTVKIDGAPCIDGEGADGVCIAGGCLPNSAVGSSGVGGGGSGGGSGGGGGAEPATGSGGSGAAGTGGAGGDATSGAVSGAGAGQSQGELRLRGGACSAGPGSEAPGPLWPLVGVLLAAWRRRRGSP
jgi:MYXO-CTERM domain-containing protein